MRSSSTSSSPVTGLKRGALVTGMGGNASPDRGVAIDVGIEVLTMFDRLLDRLRE